MSESERGQVTRSAAEVYEEFFVPALFQPWASRLTAAAEIRPGQRVLDVACGTGVLACSMAERVGPTGSVVGVDVNEGMLAVAKRKAPTIEWREVRAEALPFAENSFDAVGCQFGLMFFENKRLALQEMRRVLRRGGRLAVAVWDSLEHFEGYKELTALIERLYGVQAAAPLRVPFSLGDPRRLSFLFVEAGIADVRVERQEGTARFPSLGAWVFTEVKGWVLADRLDKAQFELLLKEAQESLRPFVAGDGTVALRAPAYLITATKA
jgi:ubiquinone/menaquinone biosynthesis C-methylase UbiE